MQTTKLSSVLLVLLCCITSKVLNAKTKILCRGSAYCKMKFDGFDFVGAKPADRLIIEYTNDSIYIWQPNGKLKMKGAIEKISYESEGEKRSIFIQIANSVEEVHVIGRRMVVIDGVDMLLFRVEEIIES